MSDIVERLRTWTYSVDAAPVSDMLDQAADEIERLRSLTRFQDGVIRSGGVACLTQDERSALERLIPQTETYNPRWAATLRGLLERLT